MTVGTAGTLRLCTRKEVAHGGCSESTRLPRSDLGSALVAAIIVAGLCSSHFGCRRSDDVAPPIPSPSVTSVEKGLEITVFPRDGEVIRDLDRSVVVEFSMAVDPEDFFLRGSRPIPAAGNRRGADTRHKVDCDTQIRSRPTPSMNSRSSSGRTGGRPVTAARPSTLQLNRRCRAATARSTSTPSTKPFVRFRTPARPGAL